MKLNLLELWDLPDRETAEAHLEAWYQWVTQSEMGTSMKRLAKTIKAYASLILNSLPNRLTNGLIGGEKRISRQTISKPRVYRNTEYHMVVIYPIAGKLNL